MKFQDTQIGEPEKIYQDTKSNIISISSPQTGWIAYATDTNEFGVCGSGSWVWLNSSGSTFGFNIILGDNVNVISTGSKGDIVFPFNGALTSVTILANTTGSLTVNIMRDSYANYPPTQSDDITSGSSGFSVFGVAKNQDNTLTGWNKAISSGDTLRFYTSAGSVITQATLCLQGTKI